MKVGPKSSLRPFLHRALQLVVVVVVIYKYSVSKKLLLQVSGLLPLQRVFKMKFNYSKSFL